MIYALASIGNIIDLKARIKLTNPVSRLRNVMLLLGSSRFSMISISAERLHFVYRRAECQKCFDSAVF